MITVSLKIGWFLNIEHESRLLCQLKFDNGTSLPSKAPFEPLGSMHLEFRFPLLFLKYVKCVYKFATLRTVKNKYLLYIPRSNVHDQGAKE